MEQEPERNWNRTGTQNFDSQRLHLFSLSGSFGGRKREGLLKAMEHPHSATGDGGRVFVLWVHAQCVYEQCVYEQCVYEQCVYVASFPGSPT